MKCHAKSELVVQVHVTGSLQSKPIVLPLKDNAERTEEHVLYGGETHQEELEQRAKMTRMRRCYRDLPQRHTDSAVILSRRHGSSYKNQQEKKEQKADLSVLVVSLEKAERKKECALPPRNGAAHLHFNTAIATRT
ncbi:unnamed protein product [Pleuronectes platessa]|uniref:Uncharacterized protein n=1 Tax=Pleuronectes platessa TaxID=8262 RepID=A0A9N7UHC7_PLEPL|nr:unnamed protein product [Pleuronectes platessa]